MDETLREITRLWTLAQPAVSAFVASIVRDIHARDDVLQDVGKRRGDFNNLNNLVPDQPKRSRR